MIVIDTSGNNSCTQLVTIESMAKRIFTWLHEEKGLLLIRTGMNDFVPLNSFVASAWLNKGSLPYISICSVLGFTLGFNWAWTICLTSQALSRYIVLLFPVADTTGSCSVYTEFRDCEIMFHVSTLLPYQPHNRQQVSICANCIVIGNSLVWLCFCYA